MPPFPEHTSRKSVTLPESMWKAISEYRFYNRIPAEAEAIRQLIQRGLDLPKYSDASKATIGILARRIKHYPGPFSAAHDAFAVMELLAVEVQKADQSLTHGQAAKKAEHIYRKALDEAGADADRTCALLNVDWRRFDTL